LKSSAATASFADRLAMVSLACAEDPRFTASSIESPRADGAPNFTVDTLNALERLHPDDILYSIVGADSFLTLPRWRDPRRLLELAEWIVVSRPGTSLMEADLAPLALTPTQRARVHRHGTPAAPPCR
jgi:nicotinate-nucleotide adenylyltransferase